MPYLPDNMPHPEPEWDEREFWDYCQRKSLRFQRCGDCGRVRHPPIPICPHCHSLSSDWVEAPRDGGKIFSFTIVHHPVHPAVTEAVPYNAVVIIFPELDNVRLVSNIVDPPEGIAIDRDVELVWETLANGTNLPRFRIKGT